MKSERSNIPAGIAVIGGATAFALAIWGWNALQDSRRVEYQVNFTAEQGVYGIRAGSPVIVGGIRHGEVTAVEPQVREDGTVSGYTATLAIDPEVPLYENMRFRATSGGINGDASIEIHDIGRAKPVWAGGVGNDRRQPLDRSRAHRATTRSSTRDWVGAAGEEPVNALKSKWWPEDASGETLLGRLQRQFGDLGRVGGIVTKAEDTWAMAKADFEQWSPRYERAKQAADAAIAKLGLDAGSAPDSAGSSFRAIREQWDTMPDLRVARADEASAGFDRASVALESMMRQVDALRGSASELSRALGEIGAQGTLALQEFDAAYDEAIRAPWRVLERPDDAYRAMEARQEVARAFAEAATQHRWALKAIEDALRRDEALLRSEPALAGMLKARLEAANAEFDSERARMEALLIGPATPAGAR